MPLTDLWGFLKVGADWPPKSEQARLSRYAQNRKLWAGRHDEVYGNWWKLLREDKQASLELVFNWHRRLSKLWADLLLGEPPRFFAGSAGSDEQLAIDRIAGIWQNAFANTLYEVA